MLAALAMCTAIAGCGGGSGTGSAGSPDGFAGPGAPGGDASGTGSDARGEASDEGGETAADGPSATAPDAGDSISDDSSVPGNGIDGAAAAGDGGPSGGLELWHPTTLAFTSTGTFPNQYMQNAVTAVFSGPGGVTLRIPGYFTGGTGWAVRFSPTAVGTWTYVTQSSDPGLGGKTGSLDCVANTNPNLHGPLQVVPANPTHLQYQDGTPYFALAYESDWLGLLDLGPTDTPAAHARILIDTQSANGFHEVLMNVFAYDTTWDKADGIYQFWPTQAFPWEGTNTAPQQQQINPAFFETRSSTIYFKMASLLTCFFWFTTRVSTGPPKGRRQTTSISST
jgi:hypothetical protein